tara:strand:- start:34 stop:309 length:276 start_codon:yes stop_codon:yes gene_type:complete
MLTKTLILPQSAHDTRIGTITKYNFKNGYGASVACHTESYGGDEGLYEIALIDEEGDIITSPNDPSSNWQDVKGFLTEGEVEVYLTEIAEY